MNYIEALQRLVDGKKIKKKDWAEQEYYFIADNKIYNSLGMECSLTIDDEEELTEDTWEIYMDERDKLIQAGKRWKIWRACEMCGCENCERKQEELYKFCQRRIGSFDEIIIRVSDDEVNSIYNLLKIKSELDA